ncbi:MAG: tRNA pseudouridine(55) synthase TruB [Chlamydiae bacterium]|nr:tRNA pseudouridine(55) synthase TruB [Chlamydiota bacterium]
MTEGILLIDKPIGKTSFYLVAVLRKLTGVKKIGHAGTLDPLASGVMVLLIGSRYTRMSDSFLSHDKAYRVTIELGAISDSYDAQGEITRLENPPIPSLDTLLEALKKFQGTIEQTPPMFSAKKVAGKKLYELARKGIEIERKACVVEVKTTLIDYNYPFLELDVECSKGTYIRSIAHDLGKELGCGGFVTKLTRTRSGPFSLEQCVQLDTLNKETLQNRILSYV